MIDLANQGAFLFYNGSDGKISAQVIIGDETVWLSQKGMAEVFDIDRTVITKHLKNIFEEKELEEDSVCAKIAHTADDGKTYQTNFYNLDAIIAVGYRVNSYKATQFRVWATKILKEYLIKGFALDDERLKQGNRLFGKDYFKELLERIREIRASERLFYEKVTDLYATAIDYNKNDPSTHKFFATVQNKLEYAIVEKTSAEIVRSRADATLPYMGLKTWKNIGKDGKIQKSDVKVAKNYLHESELKELNRLVNMFLDYAELLVSRNSLLKMKEWESRLDAFLEFNGYKVLNNAGKIRKDVADLFAETEYSKFRIIQDRDYKSDFNSFVENLKDSTSLPSEEDTKEQKEIVNSFDRQLKGLLNTPPPNKEK